jgi:hypothetical protein
MLTRRFSRLFTNREAMIQIYIKDGVCSHEGEKHSESVRNLPFFNVTPSLQTQASENVPWKTLALCKVYPVLPPRLRCIILPQMVLLSASNEFLFANANLSNTSENKKPDRVQLS